MNRIYQTYYRLQKSIIYRSYVRVSVFHLNFNNVVEQSKLHPCVYVLREASRLGTPEIVLSTPWNISALAKPFERNRSKDNSIFQPSIFRSYKNFQFQVTKIPHFAHEFLLFQESNPPGVENMVQQASLKLGEMTQVLRFDRGRIYLDLGSGFIYAWIYWWNYIYVGSQIWR